MLAAAVGIGYIVGIVVYARKYMRSVHRDNQWWLDRQQPPPASLGQLEYAVAFLYGCIWPMLVIGKLISVGTKP